VAAVAGVLTFLALRPAPALPTVKLPNPNGYDDFIQAARIVTGAGQVVMTAGEELRAIVEQNAEALALVRRGLAKECAVPYEFSEAYFSSTNGLDLLSKSKGLGQVLLAEGRLAEQAGKTNEALRSYLDCVRFGEKMASGGLMIHKLVGVAVQAMAHKELQRLASRLNGPQLRELFGALAAVEKARESPDAFVERDREWSRLTYGGWRLLVVRIQAWRWRSSLKDSEEKFKLKVRRSETELRLLRVEAAVRLHRLERGAFPDKLDQLVPAYLEAPPVDPFTGQPLVYRSETNLFVLYSAGPDGKDDGGAPLTRGPGEQGDLVTRGQ
jgi:hypothetical protein